MDDLEYCSPAWPQKVERDIGEGEGPDNRAPLRAAEVGKEQGEKPEGNAAENAACIQMPALEA